MPKRNLSRFTKDKTVSGNKCIDLHWDDDIHSSDEDEMDHNDSNKVYSLSDSGTDEEITVEQQRKKIAQEYLASMTSSGDDGNNDTDIVNVRGKIAEELTCARLETQGKYFREVSEQIGAYISKKNAEFSIHTGHQRAVTCVALTSDDSTIFSGSKDNSIIRWDTETGVKDIIKPKWNRRTHRQLQSHEGEVLSLAVSTDKKYLASGGKDNKIRIYDIRSNSNAEVQVFNGHRGAVTSLAFQKDTYSLYSGSTDRCIKHWDLNEMGYLETLFGHQDTICSMDCWMKDRPVSSSSDRSLRMWKVSEDSHLVFRGHKASIDNVQYLTQESYISSGQDGSICVWKESQKKPVAHHTFAHGREEASASARWISALATCTMTDFAATGSYDGYLRLWNVNAENRVLNQTASIAIEGFINAIALSTRLIVVGVGNEHRLGRWWRLGVKNCVKVLKIPHLNNVEESIDSDTVASELFSAYDTGSIVHYSN